MGRTTNRKHTHHSSNSQKSSSSSSSSSSSRRSHISDAVAAVAVDAITASTNPIGRKLQLQQHCLTAKNIIRPETIKGSDDVGNFYASHAELELVQAKNKADWYAANDQYWITGGYGGKTDDECMVGDGGGEEDGQEGLDFLDRLISSRQQQKQQQQPQNPAATSKQNLFAKAIDCGAGVGRITKHILLRRYDSVRLIEADPVLSKRSRAYLGRKRAGRCTFTCSRLEELDLDALYGGCPGADLIWLQWTLQYLTDLDAVKTLKNLSGILMAKTGILVIKENRPYGMARSDRFHMETPICSGRYDITRSDAHHRLLFQRAGLQVDFAEQGVETNTYAVSLVTGAAAEKQATKK
jgi:hypothetical protein